MVQFTLQSRRPLSTPWSPAKSIPTAVTYVRKLRGGCQAHLLKADDGVLYAVKFIENPQGRRVLVNELLGSQLLRLLGLATPQATPIRITPEFLSAHPEVCIELKDRRMPISPGLAFASPLPVHPETRVIFDFLPDKCFTKVVNLVDFAGALVLDQWAGNSDARQCIFFQTGAKVADGHGGWKAQMIDNGLLFNGQAWTLSSSPISGIYRQHCVYAGIQSWKDFEPYLQRMSTINEGCLQRMLDAIPGSWIAQDRLAAGDLMMRLLRRASRVSSLIEDVWRQRPECFPNWVRGTAVSQPHRVHPLAQIADVQDGCSDLSSRVRKSPQRAAINVSPKTAARNVNWRIVGGRVY